MSGPVIYLSHGMVTTFENLLEEEMGRSIGDWGMDRILANTLRSGGYTVKFAYKVRGGRPIKHSSEGGPKDDDE